MALSLRNAAGPEIADGRQYNLGAALPAGFSIVNDIPRPDGGAYWLQGDGGSLTSFDFLTSLGVPTDPVYWLALRFRIDTQLTANNDVVGILRWPMADLVNDPRQLIAQNRDPDEGLWRLRLRNNANVVLAEGISLFGPNQDVAILLEFDGHQITCFAEGLYQFSYVHSGKPTEIGCQAFGFKGGSTPSVKRRWRAMTAWGGISSDDRPDPAAEVRGLFPTADTSISEFGDMVDPANGLGTFAHWDDYAAGGSADDETTFNACPPALDYEEASLLNDPAPGFTKPMRGLISYSRARNESNTKAWTGNGVVRYRGVTYLRKVDVGTANIYGSEITLWPTAPDGGPSWESRGLVGGAATEQGFGVTIERRWTAIGFEAVATDPFPSLIHGVSPERDHEQRRRRDKKRREEADLARPERARSGPDELDEEYEVVLRTFYRFGP